MMKLLLLALCIKICAAVTPVVLWHGMGENCCNKMSSSIKSLIEEKITGVYVLSLQIGDGVVQDTENSFLMNVNEQVSMVCDQLKSDPKLQQGYHAVGFSQGAQFFWIQNSLVQAEYWHDPTDEDKYKSKSIFMADINNELNINETYRTNLNRLHNFLLVKFNQDTMVVPRESEWFGFYAPGQAVTVIPYNETRLYVEDRIGLKQLSTAGKLHFVAVDSDHMQIGQQEFDTEIIQKYLKQ